MDESAGTIGDGHETRQRLLEAAGEVFAEEGFRAATVRDICRKAGANIAAVHYHFGDKARLYDTVMRYSHAAAESKYPATQYDDQSAPAEERLYRFLLWMTRKMLDAGRPAWHGKLMAREMMEPTEVLDALVREEIRPAADALAGIVSELLPPGVATHDPELVRRCVSSVIGQVTFYKHACAVIARLYPHGADDPEKLARHIADFSSHALRCMRPTPPTKGPA